MLKTNFYFYIEFSTKQLYLNITYLLRFLYKTMSYPKLTFQVKTTVWHKHVRGLFDYEISKQCLTTNSFKVSNHCKVYRDNTHDENYFRPDDYQLNEHFKFVCQLDADNDNSDSACWLRVKQTHQKQPTKNIPYLVVKKNKNQAQPLTIGDIIKLGTVHFTVMEINTKNGLQTLFDKDIANLKHLGWVYQIQKPAQQGSLKEQKKQKIQEKVNTQEKSQITKPIKKEKKIKKQQRSKKLKSGSAKKQNQEHIEDTNLQNNQNQIHNGVNDIQIQNQQSSIPDIENQIQIQQDNKNINNFEPTLKPVIKRNLPIKQIVQKEQPIRCKICHIEDQSEENPFLSPCSCKGSCAVIHVDCLLQWVARKTSISTKQLVTNYQLNTPCCQICKYPYPKIIKNINKNIPLVKFLVPNRPYIILQKFSIEQPLTKSRQFIMVEGKNKKQISIGRGEQDDINIRDISVSREHAQIFCDQNQFYIRDKNSKFGTLLQIQKDIKFGREGVSIQFGRCYYEFKHLPEKNLDSQNLSWELID